MSPGMRGNRVSSIRMPTVNPYWLKPPRTRPVVVICGGGILRRAPSRVNPHAAAARRGGAASDRQAPVVRAECLPIERLVDPRARETWQVTDVTIAVPRVEPSGSGVAGRDEEDQ